jgi:hypothetical protein
MTCQDENADIVQSSASLVSVGVLLLGFVNANAAS